MCDLATAIKVGSSIAGGIGQYQAGVSARNAYYQQAALEEAKGKDTLSRGLEQEKQVSARYRRIGGQQANQLAASGLNISEGSPAAVLEGTAYQKGQDVATVRRNAQRERWGFMQNAKVLRYQGDISKRMGTMKAVGSLINGVATVAPKWYKAGSVGGNQMGIGQGSFMESNNFYSRSAG
jgi:hypothetical protein